MLDELPLIVQSDKVEVELTESPLGVPVVQINSRIGHEGDLHQMQIYLDNIPLYENPKITQPGCYRQSQPPIAPVGWYRWNVVLNEKWNLDWGDERADEFLRQHAKLLEDRLIALGNDIITDLLTSWEGPNPQAK